MRARTRYFVVSSLLVMGVGLGTGLVAYYMGFPTSAFFSKDGPEELQYLPRTAAVVAYANVAQVMNSDLRQRMRAGFAGRLNEDGQRQFAERTGVDIEHDIDRIVACLDPSSTDGQPGAGLVLARGRFDAVKIEALMREHDAQVETYKGKRLIVAQSLPPGAPSFSLAFVDPGLIAFGTTILVRRAIDLKTGGGDSAATNDELMAQVRGLDQGDAWAVGRFDVLRAKARLPEGLANQLPPITWFAASGHVDTGIRGTLRAEARDDEAATNLRDVVRGFVALARLQTGSKPELQGLLQSLELSGTGKTVALSFDVPGQIFDAAAARIHTPPPPSPEIH